MRRAYLDTCCLIYLVEDVPPFGMQAREFLGKTPATLLCVSSLTRLECLVKPMRDGNVELVADYEIFIAAQEWLPINAAIFDLALNLRVRHRLKTPDALHLATALHHRCEEFWTNDDRLAEAAGVLSLNILAAG